ncbi:MAG: glycyl-radical enzyme activating protein, partial [Clostridia bacterium]|nr:glycyl-radical enzyme activating protein [Clostridia bacterium]
MVNELTANIFDIQRFCLFDGDGIRTTVFFKGCPLRCEWCCNPESQSFKPQLLIKPWKGCADCLRCIDKCERGALSFVNGRVAADEAKCGYCAECESLCAFDKIKVAGKSYTVDDVMEIILKDKDYYDDSNGGVTLSGGEVTAHADFVTALMDRLEAENISVMIETCGYADGETFVKIAKKAKRVYFDVKLTDSAEHERYTGKDNRIILENLERAVAVTEAVIRVPLIPGVNMKGEFYRAFGEL